MKSDPSKPLDNSRHEAFAVHFAEHDNAAQAWMHATGGDRAHSNANGSKWRNNGSIDARVAFLKAKAQQVANKMAEKKNVEAVMDAAERLLTLSGIARGSERDADRISAIKVLNDMTGEGSEAEANKAQVDALEVLRALCGV